MNARRQRPRLNVRTGVKMLLPWVVVQATLFAAGMGIADMHRSETVSALAGALLVAITALACWSTYIQGWRDALLGGDSQT